MSCQPGDIAVQIGGKPYVLRLTLGALAIISERLSAPSPQDLSSLLRNLTPAQARVLLSCLSCPPLPKTDGSAGTVPELEVQRLLPDICRVFETAFLHTKEANER